MTVIKEPHVCTPESCPEPGKYFVTATEPKPDGSRSFWCMAGPYNTHRAALAKVDEALMIADKYDPRAWWMAWGTARLPEDSALIGKLQQAGYMPPAKTHERKVIHVLHNS